VIRILKISFILLLIIAVQDLFGQSSPGTIPNGIAIQSVARDASGNAAANRRIFLKVELRQSSINGESVLVESHSVVSNDDGIFNFYIGQGTRLSGINSLIFLDWKSKIYFLNIKMAIEPSLPTPGWVLENEYVDLGTSQIWSVPYAFTSYRSVVADSAMNIAGIVSGANGGTGISNVGRKIILGGDLETKGTGNLTFRTNGMSIIDLPTSGRMVTTASADTLFNKTLLSPFLIGEPKSITPIVSSNDNSIATTNFVNVLLASDSNSINKRLSQFENNSKDSIDKKLNIKDTALMLLPYLKYTKTSETTYADLSIKANTIIDSNLTVKGNLLLNKGLKFNDSLLVSSGARIDSSLIIKGKLLLNDSLFVKGNSLFDSNMIVGNDLEVKGNLILNTGLKFNDSLIVSKGARIDSSLILKGKLLLRDSLVARGNALINGKVQLDSTLTVNKVTSLNDSLFVQGNALFDSNVTVGNDLEVKGNLILNTGLKFNDSLIVTKGARIDSSLILKGKLLLRDSLVASGNALIKGKVQLDSNVYIRGNFRLGGDLILDSGLFRRDFVVNLGEGVKFGRYNYKDTIQAKGKSIDEVFYDILTDITHPLYVAPTLKIAKLLVDAIAASSTNKSLRYEIGKNLGSLQFSSNFEQNNAGPRLTTTFKKNASNFIRTDSTDIISNLTDTLYYTSTIAYDSGAILTNRIGILDTVGRINRGTILSDTISIFPVSKNYWGYLQNADSLNITDSLLLGRDTTVNNKGFSDFASSPSKSSFSIPIAGGEKYIYYAYPAKFPDLTSVMVGPFESLDAFTKIIRNVVNAEGYSQPYKIYVSINNFSDKVEKIIIN
jgi:UDP-3-O-[3-hydroxymyristoyl] glucosamine N-acyltransferase